MNIDLWSLIREVRVEAWQSIATIFGGFLEQFWKMLVSGDPIQAMLVISLFIVLIFTSTKALTKFVLRLVRYTSLEH